MDLGRALQLEIGLIDEIFGQGAYSLEMLDNDVARISADWVEVTISFDRRDGFVSSTLKSKLVGRELAEEAISDIFIKFCGIEPTTPLRGPLGPERVQHELKGIYPAIEMLKDPNKSRNACFFVLGYNEAYNDWASGQF